MENRLSYPASLHNHSDYSNIRIRDSINKISELVEYANELGHKAIATTEHDFTGQYIKFQEAIQKVKEKNPNFKGILGNEIYLVRNGLNKDNFKAGIDRYYHFILLAKDREGVKQIQEISTKAWLRSYMARGMRRVPTYYQDLYEIIENNKGHVIGSTACLGSAIDTQLLKYRDSQDENLMNKIENWILKLDNIFGHGDFYFELQPSHNKDQIYVNKKLIELSRKFNIKYIITTDSHYLKKEDRKIHKAFLNSQNGEREVDEFYATTYLMNTEELESYFSYLTEEELQLAYQNINEIIDKCEEYDLRKPLKIPELKWNNHNKEIEKYYKYSKLMPELKNFYNSQDKADNELVWALIDGIEKHKDLQCEEAYNELNENLKITWKSSEVNKAHWSAYFLNLQHIIDVCWEAGSIVGCGRGSGVGFLLLYALDIIQINCLKEKTKTYMWRFLNPDRVSPLDVDFDISGIKRSIILNAFRKEYGEDRVANVATFGTEQSKSAIQTACRGLGLDVELGLYISSLIPADRGLTRTLSQCYYGDEEKDFKPIKQFVDEMNKNPQLWEVAQKIEGLINRSGIHAGGIIFVDEPFTESTALMRAPDGTICTAYELHNAEAVSLIKYDALSVEAMDKIQTCIDLLCEYGYIEKKNTLRETYESAVGIYNLERDNKQMWNMVWNHEISSLFQMEQQSGIQGIKLIKPKSVDELATLNSVIRLMAQEKGGETPLEIWAKYRKNINLWYDEMRLAGLTKEEMITLEPYFKPSYGVPPSQEQLMRMLMDENICHFTLKEANTARKIVGKKQMSKIPELHKQILEQASSLALGKYIWQCGVGPQMGYSFSVIHALAYSFIGFQSAYLATNWNPVYWNTACLIVNSGSLEDSDKGTDYGKIAKAINTIKSHGISISLVDINKSDYGFKPDAENNTIYYGLKALSNINNDAIEKIIAGRPYASIKDFVHRCPLTKTATINLIKAGAFDNFWDRRKTMAWFLWEICDKKKRLTLQNMPGLIKYNLLPQDSENKIMARRIYEFNRYLKNVCKTKYKDLYQLDDRAINFLTEIEADNLIDSDLMLKASSWDKIYQGWMNVFREWIAADKDIILQNLNEKIFLEEWEHYAAGTISTWEMQSMCFYYHEHELANVDRDKYGIVDFNKMENEKIEYLFKRGGRQIPIYELNRIIGTVIAKNDTRHSITLLTPDDVVNVKFTGEMYAMYKKQISQIQPDGSKKVIEKSWFTRGTLLMLQGFKRDDTFVTKSYSKSLFHQIYKIDKINSDNTIELRHERAQGVAEDEAV